MSEHMGERKNSHFFTGPVDPNGGFLCIWMHWRANPDDPDPEFPGQKLSTATYIPAKAGQLCLCGSGKKYRECCRSQRYWRPICPNPDARSFSLMAPQSVTLKVADRAVVRERLMKDVRLKCTAGDADGTFWVYWGDPAFDDPHGTLCFGDIELKSNCKLSVTALSDIRMQALLAFVREILGDEFELPAVRYEPVPATDKRSGKQIELPAAQPSRR